MNDFLQRVIWGNQVIDYAWAVGIILFVILLNRIISRYFAYLLCKIFRRQWKTFDEKTFVSLIVHPLGIFITITVAIIVLYRLNFPPELKFTLYRYPFQTVILTVGIIIQIVAFIWLLMRIIDFIANVLERRAKASSDLNGSQLVVFFKDFFKVILGIIGLMMILHFAFNYQIGSILTGLSIVGAAIALALRESLENLIASFVIFFDKPFTTGDLVKVQSITGNVERIGLRSTRIRTSEKSYVTVPNKQMVDSILDNVSLRSQIRGELTIYLNLETGAEKIELLLGKIKDYVSKIEKIQNSNVLFTDIRIQGFVVFIEFFTPPIPGAEFTALKQELGLFALKTMDQLDIKTAAEGQPIPIGIQK